MVKASSGDFFPPSLLLYFEYVSVRSLVHGEGLLSFAVAVELRVTLNF